MGSPVLLRQEPAGGARVQGSTHPQRPRAIAALSAAQPARRRASELRFLLGLMSLFLMTSYALSTVWLVGCLLLGWRVTAISSGSMSPALRVGDVVALRDPPSDRDVRLSTGTVIQFPGPTAGHVVHRVVSARPDSYTTRGDANAQPDSTPVPVQRVEGVAVLVLPLIGTPVVWWGQQRWLALAGLGLAIMLATYLTRFASDVAFDPWADRPDGRGEPDSLVAPAGAGWARAISGPRVAALDPPALGPLLPARVLDGLLHGGNAFRHPPPGLAASLKGDER